MAKRGRKCRAGERATCRVELTFTPDELRAVRALARGNRCTVADVLRLGILTLQADLDDGADPAVVLAGHVGPIVCRV